MLLNSSVIRSRQVQDLIDGGLTAKEAAKQTKVGLGTYYAAKKQGLLGTGGITPPKQRHRIYKRKKHSFIDVPLSDSTPSAEKVILVVCSPAQVKEVMERLR